MLVVQVVALHFQQTVAVASLPSGFDRQDVHDSVPLSLFDPIWQEYSNSGPPSLIRGLDCVEEKRTIFIRASGGNLEDFIVAGCRNRNG
jgi:hypothetical protein